MERYALADSGSIGRLMEQSVELAGCHRLTGPLAWKQPALLHGSCGIETSPARLPPLPQQLERHNPDARSPVTAFNKCDGIAESHPGIVPWMRRDVVGRYHC